MTTICICNHESFIWSDKHHAATTTFSHPSAHPGWPSEPSVLSVLQSSNCPKEKQWKMAIGPFLLRIFFSWAPQNSGDFYSILLFFYSPAPFNFEIYKTPLETKNYLCSWGPKYLKFYYYSPPITAKSSAGFSVPSATPDLDLAHFLTWRPCSKFRNALIISYR